MFRRIRIAILLLILAIVGLNALTDSVYSTDWTAPQTVALYPINGDGSVVSDSYIGKLTQNDFVALEEFFAAEIAAAGIRLDRPLRFTVAPPLRSIPPDMPSNPNRLQIVLWSLQLRWWVWRVPKAPGPTPRIRLFLTYYDPAKNAVLEHSVGLRQGLIGIARLFADTRMAGSNQVVIAHELLHTLGATDKYDRNDNQPLHPVGIAEPDLQPLYPQRFAELMGGRVALSAIEARMPTSLDEVLIGPMSAAEIGWTKK